MPNTTQPTASQMQSAALAQWLHGPHGQKCRSGNAYGFHLSERLQQAFVAGWDAGFATAVLEGMPKREAL